jgi:hypothetical protein
VIGGIIVSTVLSLVVVPSFFLIMDDFSWLMMKLFGRFVGRKEPEPQPLTAEEVSGQFAAELAARDAEIRALEARLGRLDGGTARPPLRRVDAAE